MKQFTGKEYMQIEIASHYGLDKELFEDRIKWVELNESVLESLEDGADDFFQYAAAVMAYRKAQKGIPTGYLTGPDACASGPQILSVIIGCKTGAFHTGATGGTVKDVYRAVIKAMADHLGQATEYKKKDVKYSLMPMFYGSRAEPKKIFGDGTPELAAFYYAASEVCPGASMLLPIMLNLWDPEALAYRCDLPDGFVMNMKVKDTVEPKIEIDTLEGHPTFMYRYKVNEPLEEGLFLPAAVTHGIDGFIVRELTARCDYNPGQLTSAKLLLIKRLEKKITPPANMLYTEQMWKKHKFASIEGVEFVNSWSVNQMSDAYCKDLLNLIRLVQSKKPFKVVCIHDQFKSHPNNVNHVRQEYINILAELADSTVLNAMLSDIAGYPVNIEKLSTDLSDDIRNSEYPLA